MRYLEDVEIGARTSFGHYELTEAEIIEIATRFDPHPWHLDHEAARATVFGELVACFAHLNCAMSWLHFHNPDQLAVVAGLGGKESRLVSPGRVGDQLRLEIEILAARPSATRPAMGIVEARNQLWVDDRLVLENVGTVLVHARPT